MALPVVITDEAVSTAKVTYTVPTPSDNNGEICSITFGADGADIRMWTNSGDADTGTDNYKTILNGSAITFNFRYAPGTVFYFKRDASTDARLEIVYVKGIGT